MAASLPYLTTVAPLDRLVLGKFGLVRSQAIFAGPETGQSGPRRNFWDWDRDCQDCLDRSGPGPDPVQTVPGSTFILGRIDVVRGSRGGGQVMRLWPGVARRWPMAGHRAHWH